MGPRGGDSGCGAKGGSLSGQPTVKAFEEAQASATQLVIDKLRARERGSALLSKKPWQTAQS